MLLFAEQITICLWSIIGSKFAERIFLLRTKNKIFKYNSVCTFHQCFFLLFILILLLPQGEVVETCQIWREESTYKFLC